MTKFKYIFLLFVFFTGACINLKDKKLDYSQEDFLTLNEYSLNYLIKNYSQTKKVKKEADADYYYPIALYFFKNLGNCEIVKSNIEKAIKKESIFFSDALIFLIKNADKSNIDDLKNELKNYEAIFLKNNLDFYLAFIKNRSISDVSIIPENKEVFPLLYDILKNNPEQVKQNIDRLNAFFVKAKIYNEEKYHRQMLDILKWSDFDDFLSIIYYFMTRNYSFFLRKTEALFYKNNSITEEKIRAIREMAVKLGVRKELYKLVLKYKERNKYITYLYAIEALNFENFYTQMHILNNIDFAKEKNELNQKLRYKKIIYGYKAINSNWLNEIIDFINDYPDTYYSTYLIDWIFIKLINANQHHLLLQNSSKIKFENFNPYHRALLYYHLYLIDENKEKWLNLIIKECPFSYPALVLTNGDESLFPPPKELKYQELSQKGQLIAKKIKLLLEFNLIEEAEAIKYDDLTNVDMIFINNFFNDFYLKNEDYYKALKYASKNLILQGSNNYIINGKSIIEKAFPLHYKEIILKYSEKYNIDPALSFAVMREESNFKVDIVSRQNAIGLMQILPATARFIASKLRLKRYNLKTVEDNIKMGIYYLSFLRKFHNNDQEILASYNAGHNKTLRWNRLYGRYPPEIKYELIPIDETRKYIRKVMQSYFIYKYLLKNEIRDQKFTELKDTQG